MAEIRNCGNLSIGNTDHLPDKRKEPNVEPYKHQDQPRKKQLRCLGLECSKSLDKAAGMGKKEVEGGDDGDRDHERLQKQNEN